MNKRNQITLRSLGAAQTVSGSKHLLQTPELNILIDCGLFQGLKEQRIKNWEALPFSASEVDVVLLTHAHLDHCGYIPILVKKGFKGKIYMTQPTKELAQIILLESAKIQEEDAEKANKHNYTRHKPALPLYTTADAEAAYAFFAPVEHRTNIRLSNHISFEFRKAGHILGAASVVMRCFGKTIVFSGDIGRYRSSFLLPPSSLPDADIVVMESTYGHKLHSGADLLDLLSDEINEVLKTDGTVLIPSFSLCRAPEIMYLINQLKIRNKIPRWLPVFMDSPMAFDATDVLCRYPRWHKLNYRECVSVFKYVIICRNPHETKKIIRYHGVYRASKIIISASGMFTGGPVLEHLKHLAPHENNIILLPGYQAEGTRGMALQHKVRKIKIHGKYYPVKAKVVEISGLSGHADQRELLQWLEQFVPSNPKVFLVHGERLAQQVFAIKAQMQLGLNVQTLKENQSVILFTVQQYETASSHHICF